MSIEFRFPDVGEGLAEAEIVRWLIPEGGPVREDQAIVEVETDKSLVEITSPVTGVLTVHGAPEGTVIAVGAVLATFESDGAAPAPDPHAAGHGAPAAAAVAAPAAPASAPAAPATPASAPARDGRRPKATPSTRGLARSLGVDLTGVVGTGAGGRILDEDVRAAASGVAPAAGAATPPAPAAPAAPAAPLPRIEPPVGEDQRIPMRGVRKAIARNMLQSWTTVPHVNSIHEVDLSEMQRLRGQLKERGRDVPMTAFLVRAAALALREFPVLNASVDGEKEEMVLHHRVNIGVAVDAPDGLIVPVIDDADLKDVVRIGEELRQLAAQTRDRSVPQERLRGGTFTVNNYGPLGGWFGTSLVKPPEVGILSIGPARDQVVPRDGQIVIRPIAGMVLAADHRVADGREIIGFCVSVRRLMEAPINLLLEG
jgi:pyruvate dehydrogenase E2 component (dihydrolipoamide acetyltransferase)